MTPDWKPFMRMTIDIFVDNKRSSISSGIDLKFGILKRCLLNATDFTLAD